MNRAERNRQQIQQKKNEEMEQNIKESKKKITELPDKLAKVYKEEKRYIYKRIDEAVEKKENSVEFNYGSTMDECRELVRSAYWVQGQKESYTVAGEKAKEESEKLKNKLFKQLKKDGYILSDTSREVSVSYSDCDMDEFQKLVTVRW